MPGEARVAVTNHLDPKRWAHRLSLLLVIAAFILLLVIAAFIAALALIIANITTIGRQAGPRPAPKG